MENLNFSFKTLTNDLKSNCIKIHYLLQNFNDVIKNDKNLIDISHDMYFDFFSIKRMDCILESEKINYLIELNFLTKEILLDFESFRNDYNLKSNYLNDMYQNIDILFNDFKFYRNYNLLCFDYNTINRFFETPTNLYQSFFNYSELKEIL